ncbi:MAG: carbon monoxide dehydrogenase, partial [Candidatus Rokuibacteriota bacterium]
EPLAVVVATDRYAAEDGAALVDVDGEPLAATVQADAAAREGAPLVHDEAPGNILLSRRFENGRVDLAMDGAVVVIERTFRTNRHTAAPMEGRGGVADYDAAAGKLTLWSGTQVPHLARHGLAGVLGLPEHKIRVVAPDVGGGFGV